MSPSRPTPRPWTAEEQKKLDELLEAGKTVIEIVRVLQRTRQAVYAQLQRRYKKDISRPPTGRARSDGEETIAIWHKLHIMERFAYNNAALRAI